MIRSIRITMPAAAALLLLALPARAEIPKLFDTWVGNDASNYFSARYTYAACVADLDNDGDPDVATASYPSIPRVTVLLNNGDGTYLQPDIYELPEASYEIIAGDFTGDGFADLVAADTNVNWFGTSVSLLRNNGDGTFAPAQSYFCGPGPVGLAAADFNDDGHLDLTVANWGFLGQGDTVALLHNDGSGGFLDPLFFPAGDAPFRLDAADFDGDGLPDVAVANGSFNTYGPGVANVLINDGEGGFAAPLDLSPIFAGMIFFPTVAASDIDLDGDADLLFGNTGLSDGADNYVVAVIENLGGAVFATPRGVALTPFSGSFGGMTAADVTGDGWPDIVGVNGANGGWTLVPSIGGGAFGTAQRLPSGDTPFDVEVADVDGDSDLDSIVINRDSLEVCVHENPGDGDFSPPPTYGTEAFSMFFDHGDIDLDKDLDIVTASSSFRILRNDGTGAFPVSETFFPPSAPLDVKLRDLDGDGYLDLLWNHAGPPYAFGTAINDGTGHFINATDWPSFTCGYFKAEIDAFDFDNDGDLDIAQIENLGCPNEPSSSRRMFISENLGNATFQLANIVVMHPGPRSMAAGDFNEDGNLDLAVTGQPTSILWGHGDLTFTLVDAVNVPGINIATADFDGDGHLDLAIGLQRLYDYVESVVVQYGYGDGLFQQPAQIYYGSHAPDLAQITEVLVGDPDGDGDMDIMASNYASNDFSFWANNGDRSFQPQLRFGLGVSPLDMSLADFTSDGIPDAAATLSSFPPLSGNVAIVTGLGGAEPSLPGDIDGDGTVGVLDLVALLSAWGPCPQPPAECPADVDGDGAVGVTDLIILLANWG